MALVEAIDYTQVPLVALRPKSRCAISSLLNTNKIIPSPSGLPRDWRGLSHIANIPLPLTKVCDPTDIILTKWGNTHATMANLIEAFKELDRWDVYYDTIPFIESDSVSYLQCDDKEKLMLTINEEVDNVILTFDDIKLREQGLDPQIYDAFLLYSDSDVDFAMEIVDKLEKEYNLKLCLKDRDLVGGATFEHEAIMRLIAERCNRIITVVSPDFLDSPENKFFVTFAQALGIKQRQRKIIPCIYKKFQLPQMLSYYYVLDYTRKSQLLDFWKMLAHSISSIPAGSISKNEVSSVTITEITNDDKKLCIEMKKPENWDCPEKTKPSENKKETDELSPNENYVVKPIEAPQSTNKSSSFSLFKKVLPKSMKEKSRSNTWFKRKKKKKTALTS